jgi:hypothetical protein
MKIRHNKKRNTAFVYEALIREGTSAILQKDEKRKQIIVDIIKEHFKNGSILKSDLECYRSLYKSQDINKSTGTRIVREASLQKRLINPKELFAHQSHLIGDINKKLEASVFDNFVPNYKTLATISQLFAMATPPKDRVILEQIIVDNMSLANPTDETEDVDALVIKSFVKKFNAKYDSELLDEQKQLLTHYIVSFMDNAVELKNFLNEEISRLKKRLKDTQAIEYVSQDKEMIEKTSQVLTELDSYKTQNINERILLVVLKTQALVQEVSQNGDSN